MRVTMEYERFRALIRGLMLTMVGVFFIHTAGTVGHAAPLFEWIAVISWASYTGLREN